MRKNPPAQLVEILAEAAAHLGADPDAIRRFVMHTTGRAGIAARLEQAARYLGGEGG